MEGLWNSDLGIHLQITRITQGIDIIGYNFKSVNTGKKNQLFSILELLIIAPFFPCKPYLVFQIIKNI